MSWRAETPRVLPAELELGSPGTAERLDRDGGEWFAAMRQGLAGERPSSELPAMVVAAGLEMVGARLARLHIDAPLPDDARRAVLGHLRVTREQLEDYLDDDDLGALDTLADADDPRGVLQRSDVFVAASRQIVIARPMGR